MQRRAGNNGMAAGVVLTPSSIAYIDLTTAQAMLLEITDFKQESGAIVSAGARRSVTQLTRKATPLLVLWFLLWRRRAHESQEDVTSRVVMGIFG